MEDYDEDCTIQEFHPTETNKCGLTCTTWNNGINLGKKIALTGILLSAAPLVLPPLAVLSAFGFAFAVPFGFYLASYAVTDKLMSTLLSKPKPPPPPLYENASGDDEEEAKEEGYEEDYGVGEEEWVVYDTCQVFDVSVEFDGEGSNEIQDVGLKDMGEVVVDMYEQDGYEEDAGEYMESDGLISDVAYEILEGIIEDEEEMSSMVGEVVVSAEIGWENDTGPQMNMEELERETSGLIASMEKSLEEMDDDLVRLWNVRGSSAPTFSSESLSNEQSVESTERKGVREAEEEISAVKDGRGETLGNDVEAVVVSVEVGGENDINVEQVEEADAVGPRVSAEDSKPKVKLGDVETTAVDACVRKLVVHTKESGDDKATRIREETDLIVTCPDTRGTATASLLSLLGQDRPEGIDHNNVAKIAGASTSKPIEGLNNEDSIWNRIKAMRAIVGYEAPQHESSVEELKALYVFTGVEPPASFSEPSSVVDVTEKLQFLMEIVGVKM